MKLPLPLTLLAGLLVMPLYMNPVYAADPPLLIEPGDSLDNALRQAVGRQVIIKLTSGEDIEGTLTAVGKDILHLEQLARRELFRAVVPLGAVAAFLYRTTE